MSRISRKEDVVKRMKQEWLRRFIIESTVSSDEDDAGHGRDRRVSRVAGTSSSSRHSSNGHSRWDVKPSDMKLAKDRTQSGRSSVKIESKWNDDPADSSGYLTGESVDMQPGTYSKVKREKEGDEDWHKYGYKKEKGSIYVSLFSCPIAGCDENYGSRDHLSCHIRADHENRPSFRCGRCDASFAFEIELDSHERYDRCHRPSTSSSIHRGGAMPDRYRSPQKDRVYACRRCPKSFNDLRLYDDHFRGVHLGKPKYRCNRCSHKYVMYCELRQHERKSGHGPLIMATGKRHDAHEERKERVTSSYRRASTDVRSGAKKFKTEEPETKPDFKVAFEKQTVAGKSDKQTQTHWTCISSYHAGDCKPVILPPVYFTPLPAAFQPVQVKEEPIDALEEGEIIDV